ncbi:MAG TPA: hypothetical protein VIK78_19650 [Ruminiclostridium sp.]
MDRAQLIEAFAMKIDGNTYQTIADKFGTTRQNVQQSIIRNLADRAHKGLTECVYPALKKWMTENNVSSYALYGMIGFPKHGGATAAMKRRLVGKQPFKVDEAYKLVKITGVPFVELFKRGA